MNHENEDGVQFRGVIAFLLEACGFVLRLADPQTPGFLTFLQDWRFADRAF